MTNSLLSRVVTKHGSTCLQSALARRWTKLYKSTGKDNNTETINMRNSEYEQTDRLKHIGISTEPDCIFPYRYEEDSAVNRESDRHTNGDTHTEALLQSLMISFHTDMNRRYYRA